MNRLLFRGTKTFWKTKSSLDLAFLEYSEQGVYEIIAYDPVMSIHAPRLYIDMNTVISMINHDSLMTVIDGVVTTFLFNHLILTEFLPESKHIEIDVQAIFNMERSLHDCLLVVKRPDGLPVYPSPFNSEPSNDDFMYEFGYVRHLHLSLRDKWRLPLILVRVSKSLPLRESDAKIWACFVHNKTQEELLNSIAFTLAARVPTEDRQVLRSVAHSALLPENCPFPGSRTGTATPLTLSNRSSPYRSFSSSAAPSRTASPARTGNHVAASTTQHITASTTTAMELECPRAMRKSPAGKLGLPPLTPSSQSCRGLERQCANADCGPLTEPFAALAKEEGVKQGEVVKPQHRRVRSHASLWSPSLSSTGFLSTVTSLSVPSSRTHSPRKIFPVAADIEEQEDSELALARTFGTVGNTKESRLAQLDCSIEVTVQRSETLAARSRSVGRRRRSFGDRFSLWASGLLQSSTNSAQTPVTLQRPTTSTDGIVGMLQEPSDDNSNQEEESK